MTDQTKATPRPWKVSDLGRGPRAVVSPGAHLLVAECEEGGEADAELIVRAVNSHDELLEAARAALSALMDEDDDSARTEGQRFHELTMQLSDAIEAAGP